MFSGLQLDLEISQKEAKKKAEQEESNKGSAGGLSFRRVADLNRWLGSPFDTLYGSVSAFQKQCLQRILMRGLSLNSRVAICKRHAVLTL